MTNLTSHQFPIYLRRKLKEIKIKVSFTLQPTTASRKYTKLRKNRKIALAVDIYNTSINNKAVIIQGIAVEFIDKGEEFRRLYNLFYQKFEWIRRDPWNEGEAAFVKVNPLSKVSWGLG